MLKGTKPFWVNLTLDKWTQDQRYSKKSFDESRNVTAAVRGNYTFHRRDLFISQKSH